MQPDSHAAFIPLENPLTESLLQPSRQSGITLFPRFPFFFLVLAPRQSRASKRRTMRAFTLSLKVLYTKLLPEASVTSHTSRGFHDDQALTLEEEARRDFSLNCKVFSVDPASRIRTANAMNRDLRNTVGICYWKRALENGGGLSGPFTRKPVPFCASSSPVHRPREEAPDVALPGQQELGGTKGPPAVENIPPVE